MIMRENTTLFMHESRGGIMQHKKLLFTIIAFIVMLSIFTVSASAMEARSLLTEKDQKIYDIRDRNTRRYACKKCLFTIRIQAEMPGNLCK